MTSNLENYKKSLVYLIKHPYSFYYLCSLFKNEIEPKIPTFFDRIGIIKSLQSMDNVCIEESKYEKKKHKHKKQKVLSKFGKNFCEYLEQNGIIDRVLKIETKSKDEFIKAFEILESELFPNKNDYKTDPQEDEILKCLGLPFEEDRIQSNVKIRIIGYKRIDTEDNFYKFSFKINVTCSRCNNVFMVIKEIAYSDKDYKPQYFEDECPKCSLKLYCDSYFGTFHMYV